MCLRLYQLSSKNRRVKQWLLSGMFTFKIPFIILFCNNAYFHCVESKHLSKHFPKFFCRISSVDRDHRVNIEEKTRHTYTLRKLPTTRSKMNLEEECEINLFLPLEEFKIYFENYEHTIFCIKKNELSQKIKMFFSYLKSFFQWNIWLTFIPQKTCHMISIQ